MLSGEQPPRTWSGPVALRDVPRASIAETEDLERVEFVVDERPAVVGHCVTGLTHLLAELTENAVRFSPPDTVVTIRARPHRADRGGYLLTVEEWGVGMPEGDLAATNALLARPPEVDLSVSRRLGFHVVARLAARHGIGVSLTATPGAGVTAVVALPSGLFAADAPQPPAVAHAAAVPNEVPGGAPRPSPTPRRPGAPEPPTRTPFGSDGPWSGRWQPEDGGPPPVPARTLPAADHEPPP